MPSPVAVPVRSWVQIDLDTTAPVLALEAPARVAPPESWVALVRANEDLGGAAAVFTDSLGTEHRLGVEQALPRLLTVVLPTTSIPAGPGELRVVARDRACNAVEATVGVLVVRPDAFEVEVSITGPFGTAVFLDRAYETESGMDPGLDIFLEITRDDP